MFVLRVAKLFSSLSILALLGFICLHFSSVNVGALNSSVPVNLTVPATTLTFNGYAAPFAQVVIQKSNTTIATIAADQNGFFTKTLSASSGGIQSYQLYYTDIKGSSSKKKNVSISVVSQQDNEVSVFLSPTLNITKTQIEVGSLIQFRGYTVKNADVSLVISDGIKTVKTKADASGFYEFLVNSSELGDGGYFANVSALFSNQKSDASVQKTFTIVNSSGPSTPDITVGPLDIPPPTPLAPEDGSVIEGNSVTITGESRPNAQINIYEDGVIISSVFADGSGKWQFLYVATFSPVTLSFEACIDDKCSILSKTITLEFTSLGQRECKTDISLYQYRYWGLSTSTPLSINVLRTSGDGILTVDWGDGSSEEKFDHDSQRPIPYQKKYNAVGTYNGKVTFSQNNCEKVRYFSASVTEENRTNKKFIVVFLLILLLVGTYLTRKDRNRKNA